MLYFDIEPGSDDLSRLVFIGEDLSVVAEYDVVDLHYIDFGYGSGLRYELLSGTIVSYRQYADPGVLQYEVNDLALEVTEVMQESFSSLDAFLDLFYGAADRVNGSSGDDELFGFRGNDTMFGNAGSDRLDGAHGSDVLRGGRGADRLVGRRGADDLSGGSGADRLLGGLGQDVLRGNGGRDSLFGSSGRDELFGGNGVDVLSGGDDNDSLDGGAGDDDLSGDDGEDTLSGEAGADTLSGGLGADVLSGGDDNDSLDGGAGADDLSGDDGEDTLSGGAGTDTLSGGLGADVLSGGDDNDSLDGGAGDDTLQGGAGADTLNGGGADGEEDRFVFYSPEEMDGDQIQGFVQGEDLIVLDGFTYNGTDTDLVIHEGENTYVYHTGGTHGDTDSGFTEIYSFDDNTTGLTCLAVTFYDPSETETEVAILEFDGTYDFTIDDFLILNA